MKVKDFLAWLRGNNVDEDSEIETARYLDKDFVAYGNFFENDLEYDEDMKATRIWVG